MCLSKGQNDNFAMIKYQIHLINHSPPITTLFFCVDRTREKKLFNSCSRGVLFSLIFLRARNFLLEGKGIRMQNGVAFVENMIILLKHATKSMIIMTVLLS